MENTDQKWQELLEKWNSGNFTRADEQALQRLMAESDAFAREAMDGYFSNPETDHQLHLERLREKLREKQPQKRPFLPFYLMAAAAALLLVVVAIWAFWPTPPPTELATNLPSQEQNNANDQPAPPASAPRDNRAVKQRSSTTPTPPAIVADDVAVLEEKEDVAPPELSVSAPVVGSEPPPPPVADAVKTEDASQNEVAPIRSIPQTASNTGFPAGSAAKKRSNASVPPAPSVGWEQFKNDVETKVKLTQAAKDNGIKSGLVSMILDIRPADGKVRSVLFINRLGYGCDEVAEQFVQQYTWTVTPGGPTQIEVEIEFRQ